MLDVEQIHTYYGAHHVLQGVSFKARPGKVTALLGRNGAGKSTCLHSIMGFLPTRSGDIRCDGRSLLNFPPYAISRRGVALVPQGKRLFPSLTVRENLTMAARSGGWTLQRVYGLFPVLQRQRDVQSTLLSGGEQQMLIVGRALLTNPRVILMDEPSEGLAPVIVRELGEAICRLAHKDNLAIILVEQNLRMALDIADEIVVLNMGQVVYRGTAAEFRSNKQAQLRFLGVS